jgi:hypothetical protein
MSLREEPLSALTCSSSNETKEAIILAGRRRARPCAGSGDHWGDVVHLEEHGTSLAKPPCADGRLSEPLTGIDGRSFFPAARATDSTFESARSCRIRLRGRRLHRRRRWLPRPQADESTRSRVRRNMVTGREPRRLPGFTARHQQQRRDLRRERRWFPAEEPHAELLQRLGSGLVTRRKVDRVQLGRPAVRDAARWHPSATDHRRRSRVPFVVPRWPKDRVHVGAAGCSRFGSELRRVRRQSRRFGTEAADRVAGRRRLAGLVSGREVDRVHHHTRCRGPLHWWIPIQGRVGHETRWNWEAPHRCASHR